ncbi:MAG: hypothetical protein V4725_05450 [Bacteroidota bacterium]|nr:hypothetical protein [Ferruginibacter sp.]
MKATSTAVLRFIEDFNLMNAEGVVNFNANIEIKAGASIHKVKSEVFILSVNPKSVDSINLLNAEIEALNFPIMFQSGKEVFSYIDDICLIVIGNNAENGDYVISIFPEKIVESSLP